MSQVTVFWPVLAPVIWRIPNRFAAFRDRLRWCYTNVLQHMCVQRCKLATLPRDGKQCADPVTESWPYWLACGVDAGVLDREVHFIPFRDAFDLLYFDA